MNPERPFSLSTHAPLDFVDATHVRVGRRALLYFAGTNYLGLGRHPQILEAMRKALEAGMTQPGASRATTGEHRLYREAETALAKFFRLPAAALVPSGYLAPLAAVHALRPYSTHVLLGDQAHACVQDAAVIAGLPAQRFTQGGTADLRKCLRTLPRSARPLILTDGTFGTRGGIAPLRDYLAALPKCGWLLVDDAHGAGVVGPGGRGAIAHFGLRDPRIVQTISLAKAFGVGGGAVLGDAKLMDALRGRAAAFVGSTSMPLAIAAGVMAGLNVLRAEPRRVRRLQTNAQRLHELLPSHAEIFSSSLTPITAIIPSAPARAEAMRVALLRAGIYPPFIRYLSGPATGFFRLAVSSEHTTDDIECLASAVAVGLR